MEQTREIWDIANDLGNAISDLIITRDFQAKYSDMFDRIDKNAYEKIYDHDKAAIMERVLLDRLFDEVNALDKLHDELHKALVRERTEKEAADKPCPYVTAADMVRGKTTA